MSEKSKILDLLTQAVAEAEKAMPIWQVKPWTQTLKRAIDLCKEQIKIQSVSYSRADNQFAIGYLISQGDEVNGQFWQLSYIEKKPYSSKIYKAVYLIVRGLFYLDQGGLKLAQESVGQALDILKELEAKLPQSV